ncbi:MAG: biotin transporter BioY [Desulfurococcaceae archaeon]|nr:MAG: biotin transporter BioY [Desulfurococcaceae archaeon]
MVLAAFMVGLTAVAAQIRFAIGPVPFTLQTSAVMLSGLILRPRYAFLAQALYLILIALGLPIASGLRGGLGVIVGYTGGYIVGFVLAAFIYSLLIEVYLRHRGARFLAHLSGRDLAVLFLLALPPLFIIYILGFVVFTIYAIPGTGIYRWAEGIYEQVVGSKGTDPLFIVFFASVLVFLPKDLVLACALMPPIAREISRILIRFGIHLR